MRLSGAKVHLSLHQYRQHRGVSRRFSYISDAASNKQASVGRLCMRPWPDRDDARGGGSLLDRITATAGRPTFT